MPKKDDLTNHEYNRLNNPTPEERKAHLMNQLRAGTIYPARQVELARLIDEGVK